jgi:tetratricopeptide (TPR) repeat protein
VAGNRRAYETAMKRAASLAWDKKWSRAIEEYSKALDEFPQDVTTLTGLGLAYAETRQLEKALNMYKQAADLSPDNPEVLQRVGHMLERLAQWPEAASAYLRAAAAYRRLHDTAQAVGLLQRAVILDPENLQAHETLTGIYQEQGQARQAARQHLIMARLLHRQRRAAQAIVHCEAAVQLDPRNTEAHGILEALNQGLALPDGPTARLQPDADGKRTLDSFVVFEDIEVSNTAVASDAAHASPAELAKARTLAQIAEAVFEESANPETLQANLLLAKAADYQTRGMDNRAIEAYLAALKTDNSRPEAHFNLGLLYQSKKDYARAIEHLSRALPLSDLRIGACFAVAECYQAWSKIAEALNYVLQVLQIVDAQTVSEDQIPAVEAAYQQIEAQFAAQSAIQTRLFVHSALQFLNSPGWGKKAIEIRQQIDALTSESTLITLAETLAEVKAELAMTELSQIRQYLDQDMLFTALEECFWAIQQVPYYLPLHLRLTEILVKQGRLEQAVLKYTTIAETYQVRGQMQRAIAIYRKALDIAPMDVKVRERLIGMLIGAGLIDQAIEQYISVADSYYQLAQVNRAVEKYTEALRYAAQGDPSRHWEVNILHRIGDIYTQRLNWRQAIRAYQRIRRIDEANEKARSYLVDLYFKTGQHEPALQELDELVELYRSKQQLDRGLSVLQDLLQIRPEELALHMRLAKLYLDLQRKEEAIAELDTVGELQLNAGMTHEAVRTIQAILRLGPENTDGYRQLLHQLQNP